VAVPWTREVVETEHLRLRPFRDDDKPLLLELLTDPEVRRHLGGPVTSDAELEALRDAVVGERPDVFCVADANTDTALGRVSFDDHRGAWEVGYELEPGAWGCSLGAEAVGAALDWWWATGRSTSLIAVTQTANVRSCRLLGVLGLGFEREFVKYDAMQSQYRLHAPV
jgi:RimJ/RimL family protein N-acetyltransferase